MQRLLILFVFVISGVAQGQLRTKIFVDGSASEEIVFADTLALTNYLQNQQIKWVSQGYYFAGIDSTRADSISVINLHKGSQFKVRLQGFRGRKLPSYMKKTLKDYQNNGYPFAAVTLDSVQMKEGLLTGEIKVKPGPKITYDSAYFFAPVKTNHSYIYQLLDVVPGDDFSERAYAQIEKKVERANFLSLKRPTDLSFKDEKAKVYLDVSEDATNSFQGVLGLQQNGSQSASVVGNIELDIQNLFRSGKQFRFSWERFSEQSQLLEVFYKHPFILESGISPSFRFDLLRQDTTFLTRKFGLGIHTFISPRVELLLEYEQTKGSLLSTDLNSLQESGLSGFTRPLYKANLSRGNLQKLGNFSNGIVWSFSVSAGRKKVDRNLDVPDTYYDTLELKTNFYQVEGSLAYQQKIMKRQAFFHHVSFGLLENDQLLENELYRLGGLASLRGFNEKELFASAFLQSRAEFRSFFEERSYVYVFYDQLIYDRREFEDYPFGLGLGFALATSAGQFSFALALGESKNQSISFSTMKAHFGYISRF